MKRELGTWDTGLRAYVRAKIPLAALKVGAFNGVVKLASMGSTLVIASLFGTGDAIEAFLVAFLLPSMAITVVSGSVSGALIPTYVRVWGQEGDDQAQALFSSVLLLAVGLLAVVTGVLSALFPLLIPVLGSGFSPAKISMTVSLFYVLVPAIIVKGAATVCGCILNARECFLVVAAAPVALPVSTVLWILLWPGQSIIYALAAGTICGMCAEFLLLIWALRRQNIASRPRWRGGGSAIREVVAQYWPMLAGALLMSGTLFVDRAMAASLASGSVASLDYASRLVRVILYVSSGAIGTAVLPFFSRLVERRDWTELRRLLKVYTTVAFCLTSAAAVFLMVFSQPLISGILQRGLFDESDTAVVARIQAVYALQMPFYVCGVLLVRLVSSMMANRTLLVASMMNLIVNIVLNYLFMSVWGIVGIALSTVVVYLCSFAYLALLVYHQLWRVVE